MLPLSLVRTEGRLVLGDEEPPQMIIAYHLLKRQCTYQDLGADYFNRLGERDMAHRLVKRLIDLGYCGSLQKAEPEPQTA